jgi:hypothetical protein
MSAIPLPVQTVLDLFETHLGDVRFGDVDAQSLARVAGEVRAAADVVAAAQAALESARVVLHERQEALLAQAQRGLAYARVYAEADAALSAQLEAVSLPRAARRPRQEPSAEPGDALVLTERPLPPARRPRGRPRKVPLAVAPAAPLDVEPMLEGLSATGE